MWNHLTAFLRLLARHASRRGLVDHKRSMTTSSGRRNTAFGGPNPAIGRRYGTWPMTHIALRSVTSRVTGFGPSNGST